MSWSDTSAWMGVPVTAVATLALALLVSWITWTDLKTFTIPNLAVVALVLLAAGFRWSEAAAQGEPLTSACLALLVDAVLPGLMLFGFREFYYRRKGIDGLGFGDVKLAAGGGALVGSVGFFWALFGASAGALAVVTARMGLGRRPSKGDKIAFGAALAPAILAVWVCEQWPALRVLAAG